MFGLAPYDHYILIMWKCTAIIVFIC
uniref:Uncharacterized protein n=1 Tax=Arundo donax TaxID=35708 RepID=A0A0A8ZQY1_ARUDO